MGFQDFSAKILKASSLEVPDPPSKKRRMSAVEMTSEDTTTITYLTALPYFSNIYIHNKEKCMFCFAYINAKCVVLPCVGRY